ncbi:hypothetical protein SAMN04487889_10196 [Eubacterium pyruvativorans]|nr:hypothetical protein SAMN04487889_10196 [Eubacterium pyruvativorans]
MNKKMKWIVLSLCTLSAALFAAAVNEIAGDEEEKEEI